MDVPLNRMQILGTTMERGRSRIDTRKKKKKEKSRVRSETFPGSRNAAIHIARWEGRRNYSPGNIREMQRIAMLQNSATISQYRSIGREGKFIYFALYTNFHQIEFNY